ncbi:DUF2059 domain-containing protein [Myroides odoratimimus]|uniref:Uncharacterized protein n=4 Tax=Myroides TaxID=76831 RepID=A0A0U3G877_9FLAO|nr:MULTISPECIES: DUF2059 domain-containing protein [Myroides]AJA69037.1 Uncharacterized protein conserved in bacteria DUF2059 [Myroides sp. A21]ALU26277.1 hypothetical protein AS202_09000 [Myroides odoratimimus]EHO12247.1 hypothetical protein HMPREF9712_00494 [Myroides odoratimimus CCUG 10230]EHO13523.1 hypothetical protein HMPREF9714_00787 [Myroides odoratimimus CCUG 12901]EHO14362.1 hypothetical protein HMPREF9715_00799 [Myroides odoratimimus CIP 101113]
MRKIILAFAMVLVAQFSFAQDAFKADTKKYMDLSGQLKTFELLTKELSLNVEETKRADFEKELKASMVVLVDKMAEMYMTEFSHEDVKQLIQFYESPVGKKLSDKSEVLFEKGQKVGEEWAVGLQGIMMKYMQE